ncbi:phage tail tape measure protein [Guyparkeria sp.]|uniref:phage tail tape measure protein n=1 Tax=Guyparkeria sp. TaxID=2035736 RepID=UPI003970BF4E
MADKKSTVELIFQGVDKTGAATQSALRNAERFSSSLQNVTSPIRDITTSAVKLEAGLLATGAAITAFSIKAAGDFDSAFREIATLIDQPIDDLGEFKDAIIEYSTQSTQPLEDITTAIYAAISNGTDYADSIAFVSQAEKLAVAGRADLVDTTKVLAASMEAYGASANEAERFSDALFTTVKQGQTTLPELGASLSQVTTLAASAGVDFDELLSAVAALTAAGAPTSQAITQIRGAISGIIKPTSEAQTLAAELGIDFNAAALESKGLSGVLKEVEEATGGNNEQMAKLFGSMEALGGVMVLTGKGAESFEDSMRAMEERAGSTATAYEKMVEEIGNLNQNLANNLRAAAEKIGRPLLDEYGGITEAIGAMFKALGSNVSTGELGEVVDYIESQMQAIESVLLTAAQNLPEALDLADFDAVIEGIDAVVEAVSGLLGNIDLSTAEGLAQAMTKIGQAFGGLSQFTAGVIESFEPLVNLLIELGSGASELDSNVAKLAGNLAGITSQVDMALPLLNILLGLLIANTGKNLVTGFGKADKSALAMGKTLKWLGGPSVALAAGYALGTVLKEGIDAAIQSATGDEFATLGTQIYEMTHAAETNARIMQEQAAKLAEAERVLNQTREDGIEGSTQRAIAIAEARKKEEEAARKVRQELETLGAFLNADPWGTGIVNLTENLPDALYTAEQRAQGFVKTMEDGVPTFTGLNGVMDDTASSVSKVGEVMDEAERQSEDFRMKMEELASDERIANIEANVQLNVAELEAQTQRVEAAFESINTGIQSTGDLLGTLFGNDAPDWDRFGFRTMEQVQLENDRREKLLKLQERMTEAEIRALNAKASALQSGQPLIQVDGAGLQPHLEAFMWEILRTVQTRVNEDGLEMLTGI